MNKKTVIPEPERHFLFSTKLMVMAIVRYEEEAPKEFCPYTIFALKKLRQFVDSRKEMTAQSCRFFVEHAYNQFFQHEASHQSATARAKAKDIGAGEFQTSTKLAGYVWIAGEKKMTHVPKDQAYDVDMEDRDEDADEELDDLPRLQVIVKPQEKKDDDKGVSSLQREETQEQDGPSGDDDDVLEDVAPITRPEDRHGQHLVRQLSHAHQRLLLEITLSSQNVLRGGDLEGRRPPQRGEISYSSMQLMTEFLSREPFSNFMEIYGPSMQFEISYDDCHELHLSLKEVPENNRHLTVHNFEDVEVPDLADDDPNTPLPRSEGQGRADPEYKGSFESLSHEDKRIILETDDDDLVECTLQWLRMCNKNVQKKVMLELSRQRPRKKKKKKRKLKLKKNKNLRSQKFQHQHR